MKVELEESSHDLEETLRKGGRVDEAEGYCVIKRMVEMIKSPKRLNLPIV